MVKLTRADQLKLEADKKRGKSIPVGIVSVDFYDTDILGKTIQKVNSDGIKSKPENKNIDDEQELELEFHEQYFS
jgi:hypothetical protein